MSEIFDKQTLELLQKPIPKFEIIHPSLISVLRANSEINLSNLLAYFFNGDYDSHLKEVFLSSLIDCIDLGVEDDRFLNDIIDKGFENIEIIKEYQTNTGRIDILIINNHKRNSEKSAIIIENKLYHEVNNDFDDYFYSVSNDFLIEPKNIAVVILSLKEYHSNTPSNMKNAKVLHRDLKKSVLSELGSDLNLLYDKSSGLLVGEYLKHIDDLYLEFSSYGNVKCYRYYSEHRIIINKIVDNAKKHFLQDFGSISDEIKKLLFENRSKLEELIKLHENINKSVNDYFIHYTKITDRNVQGKDYFRGRGLSYDAIRYKFDFQSHLEKDHPITLHVSLDDQVLRENNIDMSTSEIEAILKEIGVKIPLKTKKNQWYLINEEELEIDETMLNSILKNNIEKKWGKLEDFLSSKIKISQINKFNEKASEFIRSKGLECKITGSQVNYISFSNSTTFGFVNYSIKFSPPDLVEIILYINYNAWDKINEEMLKDEDNDFILFSEKQSYQILGLESDYRSGVSDNYDALLKRSFRIRSLEELPLFLELESKKWIEKEKKIMSLINIEFPPFDHEEDIEA